MKTEHLKQLREAFKLTTKGIWCSIPTETEWGLVCNEVIVGQKMSMADAYLVDVMHAHFISLIDEVEELQREKERQKENTETLELSLETSKNEANYWHGLYKASIEAASRLSMEIVNNG